VFDIGWTEMLVLGVIVLLVVGPRELPTMLRTMGQYVAKFRRVANDFRYQLNDLSQDVSTTVSKTIDQQAEIKQLSEVARDLDAGVPDLFAEPETPPAEDDKGSS
jgi:sec-independent protein translocase protein TatB